MTGTYQPGLVFLSVLVAIFVSHTALSLSARVARAPRRVKPLWLVGGSVAMGVGIWSMHFIGMLAFALPIALSYSIPTTLGSLVIAIASSSFALALASHPHVHTRRLAWGALIMGGGICAMHYSGMAAIQIVPMITYEPLLVVASVLIAVGASFAALWLFSHLGSGFSLRVQVLRISAAFAMGLAISGMHYTGMAASRFASGSYCLGGGIGWQGADSRWLALIIGVAVLALLAITTLLLLYHADLEAKNRQHNRSLAEANAQLQHVATHDALTGLPNRLLLRDRLEQAIAQSERDGQRCAVLVVDLDRFKAINDSLGHQAGDALLREVSARLGSQLRRTDTLARLGGDEFVLVLREIAGPQQAEAVAGKLLVEVSKPLQLAGLEVQISSSIGISICPDDAADSEQLLQHADAAMFHAKKSGRNMCQFFAPAMNAFSRERLEMENGLRRALEVGELELHYQPKVDISTGRVRSAEALLRWQHPTRGLILPAGFVPLAEETGLIIPIGEWVLNEACRQARAWQLAGVPFVRIAVNLSAQQFKQTNLVDAVRLALNASQLDAGCLELELTETAVMQDAESSVQILRRLSELGVRISVDDFGTGYSSLSYLRRLPLDKLKIDSSFIRELASSRDSGEIVRAIVSLAHSLHLKVVAEGVETADQLAFLHRVGCDQYQGYHYSVPVPAAQFATLLRREHGGADDPSSSDITDTLVGRALRST